MNLWFLIAAPAWVILLITAAARLHDMGRSEWRPRDHVRRIGMILVGVAGSVILASPFTIDGWQYPDSTWRGALIAWGFAAVWTTTPGMPPWWDFILGVHRQTEQWKALGWRARIRGELKALRDSFRPRRRRPLSGPVGPLP